MRGRRQHGLGEDALHRGVGALAGRAAGAVGHRDEIRRAAAPAARSTPTATASISAVLAERIRTRRADPGRAPAETKRLMRGSFITPPRVLPVVGCASTMRGSRASQSETAILPSGPGGNVCCRSDVEAGGFQPLRHRLGGEAEPAMGVLLAQEFEIVRREVDDQQAGRPAAARAPPRGWRARRRRGSAAPDG